MLSKTTEYALRSIVYIAMMDAEGKRAGLKEIANELELPSPFIGKILQDLVRKGVISSVKGPHGGFFMHRPSGDISIMEVVRHIDGLEAFKKCGMGMKQCSDKHPCPLHNEIKAYRDNMLRTFSNKTIKDLVDGVNSGKFFIKNEPEEVTES
ncbi:RrF2 family transcriptional regulator [Pontibacter ruber]|uniref:RrF2 family transcriptional regulator n=1 Tax=Pontibacter ruber TaxID=1343895 RepID=A0ABW5CRU4_9BACT|nr:Rrf2 family transcriptional regulator [Pontibacter ruber]